MAIAPSNPERVYAVIENVKSALYRSDDGGKTWTRKDDSQRMVWRPFYFSRLVVDPTNPDRVYKPDYTLIASEDGGGSAACGSIASPVDRDLFVVYSALLPLPFREALLARGIALVEVPEPEFPTLGCNVLAVAPRTAVLVAGNPETRARLQRAGVHVHEVNGREICLKGGGGPTCLTRPLVRE